MSFYLVEVDNDGFKVYNSSGTLIDPATDAVAQAIRDRIGEIDASPTANTLQDRLKGLKTSLDSIKDTDGIKKITDALPVGDNIIGRVKPYDHNGNALTAVDGDTKGSNRAGIPILGTDGTDLQLRSTDIYGAITTTPSDYNTTAFGESRIAEPYQLANLINKYNVDANEYGTDLAGAGTVTHEPTKSALKLHVGTASGDKARLRTHNYYKYRAGRGLFVRTTNFASDSGQTNQRRRWGFFDDNDGVFWELNGTALRIVRRTSTSGSIVDNVVEQASWNQDTMDGNGPSGVDLDVTKGNIYEVQLQWLGVGIVGCYINGTLAHRFNNPNTIAGPYMRTAVLPLAYEIENTGASTASDLYYICGSVLVEGGEDQPEYSFGASSGYIEIGVTEAPLLSIRPALTFNSIENRMHFTPIEALIATEGKRADYKLILDGTLTGASFSSVDSESGMEKDTTASAISGGLVLLDSTLPNAIDSRIMDLGKYFNEVSRSLRRQAFASTTNTLTITGKNAGASGGVTEMKASIVWQESR